MESLLPQKQESLRAGEMGSRTWKLDLEQGRLAGEIDGKEALRQSVLVALSVPRYEHMIFSDDFGQEFSALLNQDFDYLCAAAPVFIRDALRPDSRIKAVKDFSFTAISEGAEAHFTVLSEDGTAEVDVQVLKRGTT